MKAPRRPAVLVESRVGSKGVPAVRSFEAWVRAALHGRRAEIGVQLMSVRAARTLNRRYRGRDYATNVLSFPYERPPGGNTGLLGDLVLCPAVIAREAREQGKPLRHHFAHLTVHGVLHLLGYDHGTAREAARMEAREVRILASFGIPDPYA